MKKILTLIGLLAMAYLGSAQTTALNFDGINDYVPVKGTAKLNGMAKITLETWVYVTNFNSSPCADCAPIIWNQQNSYRFGTGNTQKLSISILNGTSTVTLTSAGTISAKTWHHIAATFSGTKLKLYVDGVATDSTTFGTAFSINYPSSTSDVWVVDPATGYGGTLDETRIWDYARSQAEIQEGMMRRYPSTQPGLVLQLSYEDGTPYADNTSLSQVKDKTGYKNDGTLGNFTLKDSTSNFVLGRTFCDTIAYAKFSITRCVKYQFPSKKKTVSTSGVYQDTIASYRGCDSVMTITVKILKASTASISIANCDSVQNPITKEYYKASGKYTTTIPNYVGCDSVISFFATVYKKDTTRLSLDACEFAVLSSGKTVTASGVYVDKLKGFRGCDSIVISTVNIRKSSTASAKLKMCQFVICPTDQFLVFRKPGIYYDTIPNAVNCDSVIQYTVQSEATSGVVNISSCGSYKSPSQKYTWTNSGTYYDTLVGGNKAGCDSFMTINLNLSKATTQTLNITACKMYRVPSGTKTVTTSQVVNDVIKAKNGCDSIQYTINLTINNTVAGFTRTGNTLTASTTNAGATFQWMNCASGFVPISGATNKSYDITQDGMYALAQTENNCTDTTTCVSLLFSGLRELPAQGVSISPNPSHGTMTIKTNMVLHHVKISMTNMLGEQIKSWNVNELTNMTLLADIPPSMVLIRVESDEGYLVKYMVFE